MSLETGNYVGDLVATNPTGTDPKSQGDDHLRLIKDVLKKTLPKPASVPVTINSETGALQDATAYLYEAVVGNVVHLTFGWDIIDKGTANGAILIGYDAAARGLAPVGAKYWAIGSGRTPGGVGCQVLLNNGFISVFTYNNLSPIENGLTGKGSLQFLIDSR